MIKFLFLVFFATASAYIVTTNYDYDIHNYTITPLHGNHYKKIVGDELQIYSDSILEKAEIEEFIIVKNMKYNGSEICSFHSNTRKISVMSISKRCDITNSIHYSLCIAFESSEYLKDNSDEWVSLNEYPYTTNYSWSKTYKGFVNNYAMDNYNRDKVIHYAELMTAKKDVLYDEIVQKKFRLLIESLISYDFTFFDIIIAKSNTNSFFKNIINNVVSSNIDSDVKTGKQKIVLSSVAYTEDEDIFMNNYKAELAHQSEKEKYILLSKKYLSKIYKIEPLILTFENDSAHLYGWMQLKQEYVIPSNINTNSIMKRNLWKQTMTSHYTYTADVILHNNKLSCESTHQNLFGNIISGALNEETVYFMMVNIHFNL
jgi:hypothetical protein